MLRQLSKEDAMPVDQGWRLHSLFDVFRAMGEGSATRKVLQSKLKFRKSGPVDAPADLISPTDTASTWGRKNVA